MRFNPKTIIEMGARLPRAHPALRDAPSRKTSNAPKRFARIKNGPAPNGWTRGASSDARGGCVPQLRFTRFNDATVQRFNDLEDGGLPTVARSETSAEGWLAGSKLEVLLSYGPPSLRYGAAGWYVPPFQGFWLVEGRWLFGVKGGAGGKLHFSGGRGTRQS